MGVPAMGRDGPGPREEVVQLTRGSVGHMLEDVLQIVEGFESVRFGRFDEAERDGTGLSSLGRLAEEEVLPADDVGLDRALAGVVVYVQPSIQEEVVQVLPLV